MELIVGTYKQSRWAVGVPRSRQQPIRSVTQILFVKTVPELLVYVLVLGALAKLQKPTITRSFVTSVRLPVPMEQLSSHQTDFHEILPINFFFENQSGISLNSS